MATFRYEFVRLQKFVWLPPDVIKPLLDVGWICIPVPRMGNRQWIIMVIMIYFRTNTTSGHLSLSVSFHTCYLFSPSGKYVTSNKSEFVDGTEYRRASTLGFLPLPFSRKKAYATIRKPQILGISICKPLRVHFPALRLVAFRCAVDHRDIDPARNLWYSFPFERCV